MRVSLNRSWASIRELMEQQRTLTDEEHHRLYIDLLFSKYVERDPADDLRSIGDYLEYIAQRIQYERLRVEAPPDFLTRFESVCLLLRDRLRLYPETVQEQVEQILKESRLERIFAVMATLSDEDRIRLQRQSFFRRIVAAFPFLERHDEVDAVLPTRRSLFDAKIALNRLAQIVRYASSIELLDYEGSTEDLKDHYDPALVDKAKVLALVNILRVQASALSDAPVRERLLERLDRLDEEVRRQKPRWGRIIAALFIVFGFLADLKTINPTIYESLYRTAQAIVQILHVEGSVEHHRRRPLLPSGEEPPPAVLPSAIKVRKDEDET